MTSRCSCGYDFLAEQNLDQYRKYTLVNDEDYVQLIQLECERLSEPAESRRDLLFGQCAELCGSLAICPQCGAQDIHWPSQEQPAPPADGA